MNDADIEILRTQAEKFLSADEAYMKVLRELQEELRRINKQIEVLAAFGGLAAEGRVTALEAAAYARELELEYMEREELKDQEAWEVTEGAF